MDKHSITTSNMAQHSQTDFNKDRGWPDIDLDKPWTQDFSSAVTKLDIYYFFRHILGRLPSEAEWPGHSSFVGGELRDVVSTYLNSPEFKNRDLIGFIPKNISRVDLNGYVMYVAENDLSVGKVVLTTNTYEPGVSAVLQQHLKSGMNVIDVGANIGWFTMLSAHLVGAEGRVFAFEPSPTNGRFLTLNKVVNSFNQVTLIHAAAAERIQSLAYSSAFSNGFVTELSPDNPEAILDAELVFSLPIDLVVPEDLPVHLIKADVEGWEMKVLNGASRIINRWKPRIVAEFAPPALESFSGVTGEGFLLTLKAYGYSFSVIYNEGLVACGADIQAVMREYQQSKSDHVDVLCCVE
jgi:FkbM family methyltransferase